MNETVHYEVVEEVVERLGYRFRDPRLLVQALTHKSYTNEHPRAGEDNQRLEFLGDAVLGLVVAEVLMSELPEAKEGELTPRRAELVNELSLASLARQVDLGQLIRLGRGEEMNNGRGRASILADAVEAVVGAVYLDGGYDASRDFVLSWLKEPLTRVVEGELIGDTKTILQEIAQSRGWPVPIYRVVAEEGPDHAKMFEVEICVGDRVVAAGRGRSKKVAEKTAACNALSVFAEDDAEPQREDDR